MKCLSVSRHHLCRRSIVFINHNYCHLRLYRFLFSCNELSARCSSCKKKKWIVSPNGDRINSQWSSTGKTTPWCHIMAVENGHSVWIKRTWKIDQWVLRDFIFFLPVKKLNVGENKLFPLFEGVHSLRKSWYDCLSFHSTLIALWSYLIFLFIRFVLTQLCSSRAYLFHRFSATQNKSDDRII